MQIFGALDIILHPYSTLHNFGRHAYNQRAVRNVSYDDSIGANYYIIADFYRAKNFGARADKNTVANNWDLTFFRSATNRYML